MMRDYIACACMILTYQTQYTQGLQIGGGAPGASASASVTASGTTTIKPPEDPELLKAVNANCIEVARNVYETHGNTSHQSASGGGFPDGGVSTLPGNAAAAMAAPSPNACTSAMKDACDYRMCMEKTGNNESTCAGLKRLSQEHGCWHERTGC
jgi:hypothetical protein